MTKIKRRPKTRIEDLTAKDIRLLSMAYSLTDEQFLCFGKSYYPLQSLGLISDECQITFVGRQFVWEESQKLTKKKKAENDTSTAH